MVDGTSNSSSKDMFGAGYCVGLVQGIKETSRVYKATGRSDAPLMCLPQAGLQNGQAVRVVVRYLNDHPQNLHDDETLLATAALRDAFPCASG